MSYLQRLDRRVPAARVRDHARRSTRSGSIGNARCTAPGTSSSRARSAPSSPATRPPRPVRLRHGTFTDAIEHLPYLRRPGLRRRLPAADPPDRRGEPQGPEQHAGRRLVGRRLTVGDRLEGRRPRRHAPAAGHARRLQARSSQAAKKLGLEVALDFALQAAPGPSVGHDAPGVVHHQTGRHDRLRREPAEEVPGHLPDQLRQRPGRHLRRVRCASCGTGSPPE